MKKRKGRTVAIVAGVGVLALALLIGVYWRDIAAWAKFVYLFESIGRNEQGYAEYRHRDTGIVMVRVSGGTFLMGYDKASGWFHPDAVPQHEVTLDAFLLAKYELSQSEWTKVMTSNRSKNTGDSHPVDGLSYDDCQSFCSKTGLALPTEAQWEYACRAGTTSVYYFGQTVTEDQVNFGLKRTVQVTSFLPNAFGFHNMHGNVKEWCADDYQEDFYEQAAASGRNPVCESGSERGVLRGGDCLLESPSFCTSSVRQPWSKASSYAAEGHGFRPAYYPLP